MYLPRLWNATQFELDCIKTYGLKPQWDYALDYFGGRNPKKDFKDYTYIFFSNGNLDPWSSGGILYDIDKTYLPSAIVDKGAHHYDLRAPNAADTQSVKDVRAKEATFVQKILTDYYAIGKDAKGDGSSENEVLRVEKKSKLDKIELEQFDFIE